MSCGDIDWNAAAAWAQAVFTFLGIVVGAYIAAKVAARPTLSVRHQRLAALIGIVSLGLELLQLASRRADEFDSGTLAIVEPREKYDRAIASISAVPLLDVSPGALVLGLIKLREDLAMARDIMINLQATKHDRTTAARYMSRLLAPMIEAADTLQAGTVTAAMQAHAAERTWWQF